MLVLLVALILVIVHLRHEWFPGRHPWRWSATALNGASRSGREYVLPGGIISRCEWRRLNVALKFDRGGHRGDRDGRIAEEAKQGGSNVRPALCPCHQFSFFYLNCYQIQSLKQFFMDDSLCLAGFLLNIPNISFF